MFGTLKYNKDVEKVRLCTYCLIAIDIYIYRERERELERERGRKRGRYRKF